VKVAGDRLSITLTKVAPDFIARMAMPFFCSVPANLPIDPNGVNVLPGAGPYYISSKVPNRQIILKKNPYYGGKRPQKWDIIRTSVQVGEAASYLQVRKGEADLDLYGLPAAAHSELTKEFGINKGRYFVNPSNSIGYFAFNTSRGFFTDVKARQAVNFALDRPALNRLSGLNFGNPSEQILPPGIPGYRDANVYPVGKPNLVKAKALLGGKTGKVVLYTTNDDVGRNTGQLTQALLARVGLEVEVKSFTFGVLIDKAGTRGEPFDMMVIGWFADYPDPYDFINILLDGRNIGPENNQNFSYFNDPEINRKMDRAAALTGPARYRTYGNLDIEITRDKAPLAVTNNQNVREFISSKVGCPQYQSAWGGLNLVMLCPKG
jgi:peptide/nickel transport system substrate-binding protein